MIKEAELKLLRFYCLLMVICAFFGRGLRADPLLDVPLDFPEVSKDDAKLELTLADGKKHETTIRPYLQAHLNKFIRDRGLPVVRQYRAQSDRGDGTRTGRQGRHDRDQLGGFRRRQGADASHRRSFAVDLRQPGFRRQGSVSPRESAVRA